MKRIVLGIAVALAVAGAGCTEGSYVGGADGFFIDFDGGGRDGGLTFADAHRETSDAGPPGECEIEACEDGLDGDCDGTVDEGCACIPGEVRGCFRGTVAQRGVGACADGTMTCLDGLEFGTWGPCEGDVLAGEEVCDASSVDESCDGATNEGCDCDPAAGPVPCGSDVGACAPGAQACVEGRLEACAGGVGPAVESCNAVDDDCDGTIDEGVTRACGSDVGECSAGVETCTMGAFAGCTATTPAAAETCNGLDDDCDGRTDESLVRACGSTVGACRAGTQTCSAGGWGTCGGETLPTLETCNGIDDDCDGAIDDGVTRACGSSVGVCRPGTETCVAGTFGACTGGTGPGTEICDGRNDEDCDGTADEGCTCTTGATRPCGTDTGACVAGTQTCTGTDWGACTGSTGPVPELCNRVDDDCDGMVDEGGVCPTAPPTAMCPPAITANVLATVSLSGSGSDPDGGTVTYSWTIIARPTGSTATPASATSASTTLFLDASGSYTARFCVRDDEGETACCEVPITSRAPGALHVEVSWSTAYGDVDSHLLSTARTADDGWFTADDCYWGNRTPDWGAAGAVANPTLDRDDTDGYGPENTTITNMPTSGRYTIGVHYYCSHSIGSGGVAPGDGPTTGTVRVYCDGALIATYEGITLSRTDDWVDVATVDYPGCVGRSMSRRTVGSAILPDAFTTPRHCEIPCRSDADCSSAERCVVAGGGGPRRQICWLR